MRELCRILLLLSPAIGGAAFGCWLAGNFDTFWPFLLGMFAGGIMVAHVLLCKLISERDQHNAAEQALQATEPAMLESFYREHIKRLATVVTETAVALDTTFATVQQRGWLPRDHIAGIAARLREVAATTPVFVDRNAYVRDIANNGAADT